jgi:hypothetical protein
MNNVNPPTPPITNPSPFDFEMHSIVAFRGLGEVCGRPRETSGDDEVTKKLHVNKAITAGVCFPNDGVVVMHFWQKKKSLDKPEYFYFKSNLPLFEKLKNIRYAPIEKAVFFATFLGGNQDGLQ